MAIRRQRGGRKLHQGNPQIKTEQILSSKSGLKSMEKLYLIGTEMFEYGIVSKKLTQYEEALEYFEKALVARKFLHGPGHDLVNETHLQIGDILINLGRNAEAAYHFFAANQKSIASSTSLQRLSNEDFGSDDSSISPKSIQEQSDDFRVTLSTIDLCLRGTEIPDKHSELTFDLSYLKENSSAEGTLSRIDDRERDGSYLSMGERREIDIDHKSSMTSITSLDEFSESDGNAIFDSSDKSENLDFKGQDRNIRLNLGEISNRDISIFKLRYRK